MHGVFGRSLAGVLTIALMPGLAFARPGEAATAEAPVVAEPEATPAPEGGNARAQALFAEAAELSAQGKFPEACAKLEESWKLYPGAGSAFQLARCWQKIGRTASAYELFANVAKQTEAAGQTERTEAARARMEALLPKLSRLRIDVNLRTPDMKVERDGAPVPEANFGEATPVDPGAHEVTVTAPGKQPWRSRVEVTEPATTVTVIVPELMAVPAAAAVVPRKTEKKPLLPPPAAAAPVRSASKPNLLPVIISASVGVVGVAAGVWKGLEYRQHHADAKEICRPGFECTNADIAEHQRLLDDSRSARNLSYVGFGVGGLALGCAGYFLFLAPRGKENPKVGRVSATPVLGAGTLGAAFESSF